MPNPVLPSAATSHISANAYSRLREKAADLPFETFSILYYEGEVEGVYTSGFFGEVDRDSWIERVGGNIFTYQEISETADEVILYDASRERTVTIDWTNFDLIAPELTYDVIDQEHSFEPFVSPFIV